MKCIIEDILQAIVVTSIVVFLFYLKGHTRMDFRLFKHSVLLLILMICSFFDLKEKTIPKILTALGLYLGLIFYAIKPEMELESLLGGLLLCSALIFFSYIFNQCIGFGDIKVMAIISTFLGIKAVIQISFFAFMLCGAVSLVSTTIKVNNVREYMPFLPFILLGTNIFLLGVC